MYSRTFKTPIVGANPLTTARQCIFFLGGGGVIQINTDLLFVLPLSHLWSDERSGHLCSKYNYLVFGFHDGGLVLYRWHGSTLRYRLWHWSPLRFTWYISHALSFNRSLHQLESLKTSVSFHQSSILQSFWWIPIHGHINGVMLFYLPKIWFSWRVSLMELKK